MAKPAAKIMARGADVSTGTSRALFAVLSAKRAPLVSGRGQGAEPDRPACRLPLPPALSVRQPPLPPRKTPQPIAVGAIQVRCHAVEEGRLGGMAIGHERPTPGKSRR
jgi:hypothetical protein